MPKYYHFSRVHGALTAPIIHEVMIDYLQEKKNTFGTCKQTCVDKKWRSIWNASGLSEQVNNVLTHLQELVGICCKIFETSVLSQLTSGTY